jgi:hypothetical protein
MPGAVQDKAIVVTGVGGGLGRTYARFLADDGALVVINDLGGVRNGSDWGTISNSIRPRHFAARKFDPPQGPGTAAHPRCRRRGPLAGRTCACRKRSAANLRRSRLSFSWGSGR